MVKDATVDSAEGAGCHCRVPRCRASYVQQWIYTLSHFQILMNSAAVTRLFHCAGDADAAMDPTEGAECCGRAPRCREPCVQQLMLQRVQAASAEYCLAECRAMSRSMTF